MADITCNQTNDFATPREHPTVLRVRRDENEAQQAHVLTWDEARRIAANIAKLPELLSRKGEGWPAALAVADADVRLRTREAHAPGFPGARRQATYGTRGARSIIGLREVQATGLSPASPWAGSSRPRTPGLAVTGSSLR